MRTMLQADPDCVLAFLAVAERASFRAAERDLAIPKSTLSQRVAQLEEDLGVRLLARTTRSVALTDIGASYLREVSPAVQALRAAELKVQELQAHPSGLVRMSAPMEMGQALLGRLITNYHELYPDVRFEIDLSDRQVNLVEEGYDVALRVGPLTDSRLIARRWGTPQRLGVYGSCEYLSSFRPPKEPANLAAHRCLAMSGAQIWNRWAFRRGRRTEHVDIKPIIAVNSFTVLAELIENGVGLGRMPQGYAQPLLKKGLIREVLARFALPAKHVFVVYPSARHISPAVRALVDLLLEEEPTDAGSPDGLPRA